MLRSLSITVVTKWGYDMSTYGYPLASLPEMSDEEELRRILEGLDDVDAGRTVPHEAVVAWARTFSIQEIGLK